MRSFATTPEWPASGVVGSQQGLVQWVAGMVEKRRGDNVVRRRSSGSLGIYEHIDLPTDTTNTNAFADDEVHRRLCGDIDCIASRVLEHRVYEPFHYVFYRRQYRGSIGRKIADVLYLQISIRLEPVKVIGGSDRSWEPKKGGSDFEGGKQSVAGSYSLIRAGEKGL